MAAHSPYTSCNTIYKESAMPAKFTVYLDKAKKYRFNLKAANGEIIASGESYPDKKSALKGIASIQKNAAIARIVDETGEDEAWQKPRKPAATKDGSAQKRGRKPRTV
jgi:uncharacterized protein YegP (UPF0339 family)